MVLRSSFNNKYIFVFDLIAKGTNLTSKYQSCGFYFAILVRQDITDCVKI